jgi:hypothetical protein
LGTKLLSLGFIALIQILSKDPAGKSYVLPAFLNQWGIVIPGLVILAGLILSVFYAGYVTMIYRGITPAPFVLNWTALSLDGIKLTVIQCLYYLVPVLVLLMTVIITVPGFSQFHTAESGPVADPSMSEKIHTIGIFLGGAMLSLILFIIFTILCIIGEIRFSRTGSFISAFEISAIIRKISAIGWMHYLISLIILTIVYSLLYALITVIGLVLTIPIIVMGFAVPGSGLVISFLTVLVEIFLFSPLLLFNARYLSLLYDTESTAEPVSTAE